MRAEEVVVCCERLLSPLSAASLSVDDELGAVAEVLYPRVIRRCEVFRGKEVVDGVYAVRMLILCLLMKICASADVPPRCLITQVVVFVVRRVVARDSRVRAG